MAIKRTSFQVSMFVIITVLCFILVSSFSKVFSQRSKFEGKIVKKIDFIGIKEGKGGKIEYTDLENTDPADLYEVCIVEEGFPLKSEEVRRGIKAIFQEGKLEDVRVEVQEYDDGVWVRFFCKERPIIESIEFKGTDNLQHDQFTNIILVKRGEVLRKDLIEQSAEKIKEHYIEQGLFNATVSYKLKKVENENSVQVIFVVDEGEEINIASIKILGAKKIPDYLLQSRITLKAKESMVDDGNFNKVKYEQSKYMMMALYKENGYLDAEIIEEKFEYQWVDPEKKEERAIYITLKVSEGDKYYFDGYSITGNKIFDTESLMSMLQLGQPGNKGLVDFFSFSDDTDIVFNDMTFQMDRYALLNRYQNVGRYYTRVIPTRHVEEREKIVDGKKVKRKYVKIAFKIVEGKETYIENIIIKGNSKTKDYVIRRELLVKEGELYSSRKMELSRQILANLQFFKEVNFEIRPGSREDLMNLIVDVEEAPTGTVSLGGGYATNTGFSIFADLGQKNIFGTGRSVNVRFEYGPEKSSLSLSFTEPWFLGYPVKLSTSIFYERLLYEKSTTLFSDTDEESQYEKQVMGYNIGLYYRFWYFYSAGISWTHSFKSYIAVTGNVPDEILLEQSLGMQEKRTVTFSLVRSTLDNAINPTTGLKTSFKVYFTGGNLLRGDDHFIKYSPDINFYYSPFNLFGIRKYPCVIEFRVGADIVKPPLMRDKVEDYQNQETNPWLESEDRLVVGGPMSVRGWAVNSNDAPESWELRLFHRILYGVEFRIPIDPTFLWAISFFDAGALWNDRYWEDMLSDYDREIVENDKRDGKLYYLNQIRDAGMEYWIYSWGFGFKIQVAMFPMRFWFGRKMLYDNGSFKNISGFNYQFAIGDYRY